MKKKVIVLSAALMLIAAGVVSAAAKWGTFEGYNIVKLVIDGKTVAVEDTPPVILKGRTMVPLSMLEQAGVKATWDSQNYTVNIKSNNNNNGGAADIIRDYVTIMDFYNSLDDTGSSLTNMTESLLTAEEGIREFNDRKSLDNNYKYLDFSITSYNNRLKDFEKNEQLFINLGVDIEKINEVFDYYYDSIENFKECLELLEKLYANPYDSAASDSFFDIHDLGTTDAYDGIEICIDGYYTYRDLIFEQ